MDSPTQAVVLGIIEGITEFLPISSTGHLLIAEHWLGARSELFNVAIQAGAILAVLLIYWRRVWKLFAGFSKRTENDYMLKVIVATAISCAGAFIAKKLGFELPETVTPISWALLIGGIAILGIERHVEGKPPSHAITWQVAIVVGLSQILAAVFPGTSRSAATIFAAMLAGTTSRAAATEFAFLVGIPTMFAATGYEFLKLHQAGAVHHEDWTSFGIAFAVSAVTAFIAVKWLLSFIQTHRFTIFAWYRIALGALLLVFVR